MTEFLEPLHISQNRLAVAIGLPPRRINEIVHGKRISADTALGSRATSAPPTGSGSTSRPASISRSRRTTSKNTLDRIQPLKASDFPGAADPRM